MRLHNLVKKYYLFCLTGLIIFLLSVIPIRLTIASYQAPRPQAILTLGGGTERETYTARFAKYYPNLKIWVSTGIAAKDAHAIFNQAGIPKDQVILDYRAVDTVTNFTTLVEDFKQHNIQHLFLITSDFHMPRAKAIATLVLGSQGITFTPLSIPTAKPNESKVRVLRDSARSLVWIVTGRTGASLNKSLFKHPYYASR